MRNMFLVLLILISGTSFAQKQVGLEYMIYRAITEEGKVIGDENTLETEITFDGYNRHSIDPDYLISKYPELEKFIVNDSMLQLNSDINLTGWINDDKAGRQEDAVARFKNLKFKNIDVNLQLRSPSVPDEVFRASMLWWYACVADQIIIHKSNINLFFRNNEIDEFISFYESVNPEYLIFNDNTIGRVDIQDLNSGLFRFSGNKVSIHRMENFNCRRVEIIGNVFSPDEEITNSEVETTIVNDSSTYLRENQIRELTFRIINETGEINSFFIFSDNEILSYDGNHTNMFAPRASRIVFNNNELQGFTLLSLMPRDALIIRDNNFQEVSMVGMTIPSTPNHPVQIGLDQFMDNLVLRTGWERSKYLAESDIELADDFAFNQYVHQYQKLHEVFKQSGNIDASNKVLLKIKSATKKKYAYVFRTEGGATNYFRLKLHQLLENYTRHGTDPAQAMTASVFIILIFAVIYFFFPSEWDTTTKPAMLDQLRGIWVEKSKRNIKSILKFLGTFLHSVLNSITLSVNSFITLGFGRIPTSGAAKYICIFQGFLGWFLLSIFIVSLINQVMG